MNVGKCLDLVQLLPQIGEFVLLGNPITVKNMERPSIGAQAFFIKESVKYYECKERGASL